MNVCTNPQQNNTEAVLNFLRACEIDNAQDSNGRSPAGSHASHSPHRIKA